MADNFLEGAGSVSDPGLMHLAPTLFSGSQELLTSTLDWWSRRFDLIGNAVQDYSKSDILRLTKDPLGTPMTTQVADINQQKNAARRAAYDARKAAKNDHANAKACQHLTDFIRSDANRKVVAGYMPIQTEIDPVPAMTVLSTAGYPVCVPVIQGHAQPLLFRTWTPDCAMIEGDFGALIPRGGELLLPDTLVVPLVGFDKKGTRLGYGGGFYDRTLDKLRADSDVLAIGFAFGGQEVASLPTDKFDQFLDVVITENGPLVF